MHMLCVCVRVFAVIHNMHHVIYHMHKAYTLTTHRRNYENAYVNVRVFVHMNVNYETQTDRGGCACVYVCV